MDEIPGCIGAPLLKIQTRFVSSATYGETIDIYSEIESWQRKGFAQKHRIMRGDKLICEARKHGCFA